MQIKAFNIQYDTDGVKVKGLPQELWFEIDDDPDFDPATELADLISNKTGWCVFGYDFEVAT